MRKLLNVISTSLFLAGATGALYNYNVAEGIKSQRVVNGYNQILEQIDGLDRRINSSLPENIDTLEDVRNGLFVNLERYILHNSKELFEASEEFEKTNINYWISFGVGVLGLVGLALNRIKSR